MRAGDLLVARKRLPPETQGETRWLVNDREGAEGIVSAPAASLTLVKGNGDEQAEISEGVTIARATTTPELTTIEIGDATPLTYLYDRPSVRLFATWSR